MNPKPPGKVGPGKAGGLDDRTMVLVSVAKRQWERTFDAISEPLMIIDRNYVVRRANLALADDLGIAVQRVVGRTCHSLRAEAATTFTGAGAEPCMGCPVGEARTVGAPRHAELEAAGGRTYQIRAYPLLDDGDELCVCRYRDVTEERALTRKLSNAEKLAAIGKLAGGVAHEINNPLGGILAFTQILQRDDVTQEERREYLHEIERSALRCKAIVESLLRFARQSPVTQRGPVDLNDVVRQALRFVEYKFAVQNVTVIPRLTAELPLFLGNSNQVEQVLVNLLSNAFDAIASGPRARGKEGEEGAAPAGQIEVSTGQREGRVYLEVADTGPGIPEEVVPKLFDPFFTTKEEGKGTGLGLAVTYAIVSEHGGTITAANRPEGGAVFSVSFPAIEPSAEARGVGRAPPGAT